MTSWTAEWAARLAIVGLVGCTDYHLESGIFDGAPGATTLAALPVGTAATFYATEVHAGTMETTRTAATDVGSADPSVVVVYRTDRGWVLVALREGDTELRVVAESTFTVPVHVVAQP